MEKKVSKGFKNIKRKYNYYLPKSNKVTNSADKIKFLKLTDLSSKQNKHYASNSKLNVVEISKKTIHNCCR